MQIDQNGDAMMSRCKIPAGTMTAVLVKSARRCCLCFGLNGDFSEKKGQVAHVDHNPANHNESNLTFLCLEHHDAFDSRTSQSKGLIKEELEFYRAKLFEAVKTKLPAGRSEKTMDVSAELKGVATFLESVSSDQPFRSSLLNAHEIQKANEEQLLTIDPFSSKHLTASGYHLSVGEEALVGGRVLKLSKERPLELKRKQIVTLSSREILSMPQLANGKTQHPGGYNTLGTVH